MHCQGPTVSGASRTLIAAVNVGTAEPEAGGTHQQFGDRATGRYNIVIDSWHSHCFSVEFRGWQHSTYVVPFLRLVVLKLPGMTDAAGRTICCWCPDINLWLDAWLSWLSHPTVITHMPVLLCLLCCMALFCWVWLWDLPCLDNRCCHPPPPPRQLCLLIFHQVRLLLVLLAPGDVLSAHSPQMQECPGFSIGGRAQQTWSTAHIPTCIGSSA
jgi:hypothetical protein